jgi:hypothetical protein
MVALLRTLLLSGKGQGRSTNRSIATIQLVYENGQFLSLSPDMQE